MKSTTRTPTPLLAAMAAAVGITSPFGSNARETPRPPCYDSGRRDDGIARIRELKRTTRKQRFVLGPQGEAVKVCKARDRGVYAGLLRP